MKDKILIFLLGVFVTISLAAITDYGDLLTIKPAKPKDAVVDYSMTLGGMKEFISHYQNQGYQITHIIETSNGTMTVMEKY